MPDERLASRLEFLRHQQNADGGWGYAPGKGSWTEPTFYVLVATWHERDSAWWKRGWEAMRGWQQTDGWWRPGPGVDSPHWTTAFGLTLYCLTGETGDGFRKAAGWLLEEQGFEANFVARAYHFLHISRREHDPKYVGWPWAPGTSSWIEPTAHTLLALKKAGPRLDHPALAQRIWLAEEMIWMRRCRDGGWNYGNRVVLGESLPSYPETTALALHGLQGSKDARLSAAVERARRLQTPSSQRLARAWLALVLRNYGAAGAAPEPREICGRDVLVTALECLAHPEGNGRLLAAGGVT